MELTPKSYNIVMYALELRKMNLENSELAENEKMLLKIAIDDAMIEMQAIGFELIINK